MENITDYLRKEGWQKDWQQTKADYSTLENAVMKGAGVLHDIYKKRIVNVNLNIILAAYPSIETAVYTSKVMDRMKYSHEAISAGAAIADWLSYIPVHVGLHYFANKQRFMTPQGEFRHKEFWKDTGKVYLTSLPSIALFYTMAAPLQYSLMQYGVSANSANRWSYWGTMIVTRAIHTAIGLKSGLFNDSQNADTRQKREAISS